MPTCARISPGLEGDQKEEHSLKILSKKQCKLPGARYSLPLAPWSRPNPATCDSCTWQSARSGNELHLCHVCFTYNGRSSGKVPLWSPTNRTPGRRATERLSWKQTPISCWNGSTWRMLQFVRDWRICNQTPTTTTSDRPSIMH